MSFEFAGAREIHKIYEIYVDSLITSVDFTRVKSVERFADIAIR